jgi:DNA-binding MarR family transcriptional regulator
MADPFLDLSPQEAFEHFRERAAEEGRDAWKNLDRYLRWRLVVYLQDREGNAGELRRATLAAARWARAEGEEGWEASWTQHLEILRDAERTPATAAELDVLRRPEGRSAELLALLVENGEPMRPKELSERLGVSPQQVTNLGRQLEEARLIVREGEGRARWFVPTARGFRLAEALPSPTPTAVLAEAEDLAPETPLWESESIGTQVKVA